MKYAWLHAEMMNRTFGMIRPTEIRMGVEAWKEFTDLMNRQCGSSVCLEAFSKLAFLDAWVRQDDRLAPREVEFVAGKVTVPADPPGCPICGGAEDVRYCARKVGPVFILMLAPDCQDFPEEWSQIEASIAPLNPVRVNICRACAQVGRK